VKSTINHQQYSAWHVTSRADQTESAPVQDRFKAAVGRGGWGGRIRLAFWSFLVVVILGLAGFAVVAVLSGGWTVTPILSGSMKPGLPVGGVAVAERTPIRSLAVRDIILFQNPDRPSVQMVHRIIKLSFDGSGQPVVRTQGDANTAADTWTVTLRGKDVYVVQFTLPLLGYPAVYTNHGVDLMVGGAILLLALGGTVLVRQRRDVGGKTAVRVREPLPAHRGLQPAPTGNSRLGDLVRREVRSINERSAAVPVAAASIDSRTPDSRRHK
jgi:signal peptidase I